MKKKLEDMTEVEQMYWLAKKQMKLVLTVGLSLFAIGLGIAFLCIYFLP